MTVGLQVINDSGIIQIDEFYRNFVFIEKFTFATTGDHTFTTSANRTAPIPVLYSTNASPVPTAGICVLQSTKNADSSWTIRVNGAGEVYIFDVLPAESLHGFGLQVFNSAGQVVFDSSTKPLVVKDRYHFYGVADFYVIPEQHLSVKPATGGWTIIEENNLAMYAKPSTQKWGWIIDGAFTGVAYINSPAGGGPSSSPYGPGDANIHKAIGCLHAVGDNFVATYRDYKNYSGTYWNGNQDPQADFMFVDLTGL
jgi:hypothetical protein